MESRWYLFAGQTINSRVEDRGQALHITRNEWNRIQLHLDRNRLLQEGIENEKAKRLLRKEGSSKMAETWDNSAENIRKANEEKRVARLEKSKKEVTDRFHFLRQEQEEIKRKYVENAKKWRYYSEGYPKKLTSALILSSVLQEREKQTEMKQYIEKHEMEEEIKYAQNIKNAALQEKVDDLNKKEELCKTKSKLRKIYLQDIKDKEQLNKTSREERIKNEKEDIKNAEQECEKLKQLEDMAEQEKRKQRKKEFDEFYTKQKQAREFSKTVDKEQDLVINVYEKAKRKITCLREKKEQEMKLAFQARREAISNKVAAKAKTEQDQEEKILQNAKEEADKIELEKLKQKEEYRQRLIQDRQEDKKKFNEREEKKKLEEIEQNKWLMLNRYKTNIIMQEYDKNKKIEECQKKLDYGKVLIKQMAEDKEKLRLEKEDSQSYDLGAVKEEDRKFMEYAEECLDYTRKKKQSTLPVERVICEYKKENSLSA